MVDPRTSDHDTVSGKNPVVPSVSIGMPVYNCANILSPALDSLLQQTFTDFELIISDNASTDGTGALCEEYARRDPRIRYIRQDRNIGAVGNFKFVLSEAKAEYFMWAAADDRRTPDCLETWVDIMGYDPECALAFSDYTTRNLETGEEQMVRVVPSCSRNRFLNYMIRLLDMCPSLIYGLFRTPHLRSVELDAYDFFDVHLTLFIAAQSRIRVANACLYVAGTKGVRKPYSFSGSRIRRLPFLRRQYTLTRASFGPFKGSTLFLLCCVLMLINKIRLRGY